MYLKFIELFGFKTFPDKIRIPFDTGINIIVGPNGCGKTNIVDAIRFILGEQALKDLRLKNMNDIIFHGSNSRGQSSVALCRGVFVNDLALDFKYKDFSEIMVERRHFKNKETEYRINSCLVSYREYLDFFNESSLSKYYSIVDSAKISAILNYKPSDLRLFLEEASGITKYKNQKKSASKKLEAAHLNLLRINDLYGEVEKQLSALKSQSEVLENYKKLEIDKKLHEFILYNRMKRKIDSEIMKHNDELNNYYSLFIEFETKTISIENDLAELKVLSDNLNDNYKNAVNEKNKALIEITKLNSDIDYGLLTIKKLESEIENKNKDLVEQNNQKNKNTDKLEDFKAKETADEAVIKDLYEKLNKFNGLALEKKALFLKLKSEIEFINDEILDMTEKSQNVNNKLIFNDKNIKNIENRISGTKDTSLKILAEIKTAKDELEIKSSFLNKTIEKLGNIKKKEALENENILKLSNDLDVIRKAKEGLEKKLLEIDAAISKLSDFINNYEGFSQGTKRLLNASKDYTAYPLSDMIEAEAGFESAVWAGFEDILETVAVKDINDARKALNFLNNDKMGQAKIFIPGTRKNKIAAQNWPESAEKENSLKQKDIVFLKDKMILSERAFGDKILNLENLDMNLYYYKDSDDILNYIEQTGFFPEVDIITNDDVIFISSGFIIAGKNKNAENQNLLINKKSLLKYANSKTEKESELYENNMLIEEYSMKIKTNKSDIDELQKELRLKEIDELTARNDIKHLNEQANKAEERLAILKREIENLESEKAASIEEDEILKEERLSLENDLTVKSEEKDLLGRKLKSFEYELDITKDDELKLKIEINSAEQNFNFLKKEVKGLEMSLLSYSRRIDNLNSQIYNFRNEIKKSSQDVSSKQKNVEDLNYAIKSREAEIETLEINIENGRTNINNLAKELENVKKEKSDAEKKRDTALTYVNIYKEKLTELNSNDFPDYESPDFLNALQKINDADQAVVPLSSYDKLSESEIKKKIETLKSEILNLGDINMNATNEYSGALSRQNFLSDQKLDLETSIKSIESIIKKLDLVSKEKFNSSLRQIRLKFNELFIFLFGGGHADILGVTEDRSEIMEDDIQGMEINAQIPGKKFSGINILSQGERVLVAVSLLFAIFLSKKTPFCVIDEVDAPLDYANNARYNRLITEISRYSQVIMITHNKKTMEIGKNIFGVTSKQPGISKIVSVSMN